MEEEKEVKVVSVRNGSEKVKKVEEEEGEDDDIPQLSAHALAALHDFYEEQKEIEEALEKAKIAGNDNTILYKTDMAKFFPEDWQLSQFWYDEDTSKKLAEEVLTQAGEGGRVACLSCPSIFRACQVTDKVIGRIVDVFEFDTRFEAFAPYFYFYDYKDPENVPEGCLGAYDVVAVDPPFLSEECLEKVSLTVKKLMKKDMGKIILCTGKIMEAKAFETMGLKPSSFVPIHKKKCLKNPFACFTNYDCQLQN